MRIRPPHRLKSNSYTESCRVDAAGRWRERTCEYPGRSHRQRKTVVTTNCEKSAKVIVAGQSVKDRINRSLKYDRERRNELERRKQKRKLPAKG